MDDLFKPATNNSTTNSSEAVPTPVKVKQKAVPEHFKKMNYFVDPEVAQKLKALAALKGISVNVLANEVIKLYVDENLK